MTDLDSDEYDWRRRLSYINMTGWRRLHWLFPGPTQILKANSISVGSAIFAGLTSVTDRQITPLGR